MHGPLAADGDRGRSPGNTDYIARTDTPPRTCPPDPLSSGGEERVASPDRGKKGIEVGDSQLIQTENSKPCLSGATNA